MDAKGYYLCELCFDAMAPHMTTAWDGLETAVCEDCLAPPVGHPCWGMLQQRSTLSFDALVNQPIFTKIFRLPARQAGKTRGLPSPDHFPLDNPFFDLDTETQGRHDLSDAMAWAIQSQIVPVERVPEQMRQQLPVRQIPAEMQAYEHIILAPIPVPNGDTWLADMSESIPTQSCLTQLPADVCTCGRYRLVQARQRRSRHARYRRDSWIR